MYFNGMSESNPNSRLEAFCDGVKIKNIFIKPKKPVADTTRRN